MDLNVNSLEKLKNKLSDIIKLKKEKKITTHLSDKNIFKIKNENHSSTNI